ncbi:MAG: hypothetical protein FWD71_22335 [Oscillospiraceae bacterium]|nr:hypothetical protein [Oscillospiraceae bacterium]
MPNPILNMAIGAFISTYFQNAKFRGEINKNIQKLMGMGVDMLNGANKTLNLGGAKNVQPTAEQPAGLPSDE